MLKDKVAIVTGGARGIGKEIARRFLEEGAKVVICDILEGEIKETIKSLSGTGEIEGVVADVTVSDDVENVVKETVDKFGGLDILVNNAGITRDTLLMRMKDEDWDMVMDVNLKGAFLFTKTVFRPMSKGKWGRIINIASVVGLMGNVGQANYVTSKAGIIGLTKATAREYSSRGITVNAIAPGFIETDMTAELAEEVRKAFMEQIPLNRPGEPVDIANSCVFLASDLASYITGQVLLVDGGMFMR
jgi:3-oxoacyl-[acyl-carrier protein] reductase